MNPKMAERGDSLVAMANLIKEMDFTMRQAHGSDYWEIFEMTISGLSRRDHNILVDLGILENRSARNRAKRAEKCY